MSTVFCSQDTRATAAGARLRLSWPDAGDGAEYLVFGGNRFDFVPEPFAEDEIVALRGPAITLRRPNKNLVATTAQPRIELDPAFRFYRVIAPRRSALRPRRSHRHATRARGPAAAGHRAPGSLASRGRHRRAPGHGNAAPLISLVPWQASKHPARAKFSILNRNDAVGATREVARVAPAPSRVASPAPSPGRAGGAYRLVGRVAPGVCRRGAGNNTRSACASQAQLHRSG